MIFAILSVAPFVVMVCLGIWWLFIADSYAQRSHKYVTMIAFYASSVAIIGCALWGFGYLRWHYGF